MTVSERRPDSMRVVRLRAPGGPGQLAVEEAGRPRPRPGEALVRVHAAAITRDELQWPVDRLPAIPSYELAGVVEEAGPGVAAVAPGDEVFALTPFDRDGVAADYTAVPAELLAAKPRSLSRAESAAIPLPALTAYGPIHPCPGLPSSGLQRQMCSSSLSGELSHQRGAFSTAISSTSQPYRHPSACWAACSATSKFSISPSTWAS